MRKNLTLLLIMLSAYLQTSAQFNIISNIGGGVANDFSRQIVSDGNGNVFASGSFGSYVNFGAAGGLTSNGLNDYFLAKITTGGAYTWAIKIGGVNNENSYITTAVYNNAIYISGTFFTGSINIGGNVLTTALSQDNFIAKFNFSGALQWVVKTNGVLLKKIAVGSHGIYGISTDDALSKYALSNGAFIWKTNFSKIGTPSTATFYNTPTGLTVDNNNGIYVCGYFGLNCNSGTTSGVTTNYPSITGQIGNVQLGTSSGTLPASKSNMFMVKYASSGIVSWGKQMGSTMSSNNAGDKASGIEFNNQEQAIYLTCQFSGNNTSPCHFDGIMNGNTNTLIPSGGSATDVAAVKYNLSGVPIWIRQYGAANANEFSKGLTTDNRGNVYIAGSTTTQSFNAGCYSTTNANNIISAFYIKINKSGSILHMTHIDAPLMQGEICCDNNNILYTTGSYFGTIWLGTTTLNSPNQYNGFISRIMEPCSDAGPNAVSICICPVTIGSPKQMSSCTYSWTPAWAVNCSYCDYTTTIYPGVYTLTFTNNITGCVTTTTTTVTQAVGTPCCRLADPDGFEQCYVRNNQLIVNPNQNGDLKTIFIYDINGKLLLSENATNSEQQFNIENYASGLYLVQIEYEDGNTFEKKFYKN